MLKLGFGVLGSLLMVFPGTMPVAHAQAGICYTDRDDVGVIECGGSVTKKEPGSTGSSGAGPVRRPSAQGTIDPRVLELEQILERGELPPDELYATVCLSGSVPAW